MRNPRSVRPDKPSPPSHLVCETKPGKGPIKALAPRCCSHTKALSATDNGSSKPLSNKHENFCPKISNVCISPPRPRMAALAQERTERSSALITTVCFVFEVCLKPIHATLAVWPTNTTSISGSVVVSLREPTSQLTSGSKDPAPGPASWALGASCQESPPPCSALSTRRWRWGGGGSC